MMVAPLLLSPVLAQLVLARINMDAVVPVLVGVIWIGSWVMGQVRQSRKKNGGMRQTQVPRGPSAPSAGRPGAGALPGASPTQQRIAQMRAARARAANAAGTGGTGASGTSGGGGRRSPQRPQRPHPTQAARPRTKPTRAARPAQPARPVQPPRAAELLPVPAPRRAVHTDVDAAGPGTVAPCSLIESSTGAGTSSVAGGRVHAVLGKLDRHELRRAILLREVLGPPIALRPPTSQPGAGM